MKRAASTALFRRFSSGIKNSVLDCVGQTPLVRLNRVIGKKCRAKQVLAKLEMQNPGGSVKDRIAVSMLEQAEKRGEISPDKSTIVEITSGNTGIGLAMACAAKGYKCIMIMPQLPPMMERYIICRKFGAEVHLTAGAIGAPMVENMEMHLANLLAENPNYWCPRQFESEDNPLAHENTTAPEIWEQTGGDVDFFISGAGTGGTVVGAGKFLKSVNPDVINICVEPSESRVLIGEDADKHTVVGIGAGVKLPFIEKEAPDQEWAQGTRGVIDRFMSASSAEANAMCNALARQEGLLVGPSSGAAVQVAVNIAQTEEADGKTIVVIIPSSGIRYVSHPMWADVKEESAACLAPPPDFSNNPPMLRWRSEDFVKAN